ncbi:brain protein I3-like [Anopheles albimanus]|uniref:Membrane protein BRI3 n=1 Tax=Anopheles albimanus TaxID=7167 RepID=A0A182F2K2_ANOAL|nr:brain protein I3-like [Anopheles albimanus]
MASQIPPNNPPSYDQVMAENLTATNNGAAATVPTVTVLQPTAPILPSGSYPRQEYSTQTAGVPYYGAMDGNKVTTVQVLPPTVQAVPVSQVTQQIIVVNGCPACRIGMLEDDFSCLGIFCAIFFFPLGILVCLALRNRRCTNCGAQF